MGRQRVEQRRAKSHLRSVRVYSKVILGPFLFAGFWTSVYRFTPPPTPGRPEKSHAFSLDSEIPAGHNLLYSRGARPENPIALAALRLRKHVRPARAPVASAPASGPSPVYSRSF